jgi:hypothetical protein
MVRKGRARKGFHVEVVGRGWPRSRSLAMALCVALHGSIIITMGLWSFGLIMIGSVGIAAMPYTPHERQQQVWTHLRREAGEESKRLAGSEAAVR